MADWNNPLLTSAYTDFLALLKARDLDTITMLEDGGTNLPTKAKRWNQANKRFERWSGTAWVTETLSVSGGGTGAVDAVGARTNLGVPATADLTNHTGATNVHSATNLPTPSRMIIRDATGRAQVEPGVEAKDIATVGQMQTAGGNYAALGGSSTQRFKVASAAADDEAVPLTQANSRYTPIAHNTASAPHSGHETISGAQSKIDTHANLTAPHSATSAATANRLVLRDASGKGKVANGSESDDIAAFGQILSAFTGMGVAGVGSLALLSKSDGINPGSTYAGSTLRLSGISGDTSFMILEKGSTVAGTWRALGYTIYRENSIGFSVPGLTLFVRIA